MPSQSRAQWEQQHGIDSLKGTKRTNQKASDTNKVFDIKALSLLNEKAISDILKDPISARYCPCAQELSKEIELIQKQMLDLVRDLKFEEAAVLRDRMKALELVLLLKPGRDLEGELTSS